MSNSINFIQGKKSSSMHKAVVQLQLIRLIAVSILFAVSIVAVILFFLISLSPLPALKKEEAQDLSVMNQLHTDIAKHMIITERLGTISTILSKRERYDLIIDLVQSSLPQGLQITGMTVTEKNASFTITGTSLSLVDKFLNKLTTSPDVTQKFSQVILSNFGTHDQSNGFFLTVTLAYL